MNSQSSPQTRMRQYLQLVATGPELSKSLTVAQAEDGMEMILNHEIDAVQTGIFLIALRMKRETDEENVGILNALIKRLHHKQTAAPAIIALADPFNGYLRGHPATPFLPAVIAACGLPAYSHGVGAVGPKYGMTSRMVLQAAGQSIDLTVEEAAARIDNPDIGWAYLDQKHYVPALHGLVELRDLMVKRSCLSTLEVVLKPLSGSRATHLMTGFVHKAYPPVYAKLARHAGFDSAALVRGVEGGCIPSLSQLSRYFSINLGQELVLNRLVPTDLGIVQQSRIVSLSASHAEIMEQTGYGSTDVMEPVIAQNLEIGLGALINDDGPMRDSLIYGAAIALTQAGIVSGLVAGADRARAVISNGEALARFQAG